MFKSVYYFVLMLFILPIILFVYNVFVDFKIDYIIDFIYYDLVEYFINTFVILIVSSVIAVVISFVFAYFMSFYDFKFKKVVEILLILPMSIPVYIGAYSYGSIFSATGIVYQTTNVLVDIMSIWGLIFVYVIFLYPYVYIPMRAYLSKFDRNLYENHLLLDNSEFRFVKKVLFPLTIPTIFLGLSFFIFEVFSDYGAAKYFGVETFAQAINQSWFFLNDISLTFFITLVTAFFYLMFYGLKHVYTKNKRYVNLGDKSINLNKMNSYHKVIFYTTVIVVVSFGFVIPVLHMIYGTVLTAFSLQNSEYLSALFNTLSLTAVVTLVIIFISIMVGNYVKFIKNQGFYLIPFTLGYMVPSVLVAFVTYTFFFMVQDLTSILVTQSLLIVIIAYVYRFQSVGNQNVVNAFTKVDKVHYENSLLLGNNEVKTLINVELPLIKPVLFSTIMLVVLEVSKELSLVLFLRPYGYETLATKAFTYANDEKILESSMYSLTIVIICVIALGMVQFLKEKNARIKKR